MLESLQHTALDAKHEKKAYYRLVRHYAKEEIKVSKRYIKILVVRLLGDKDYDHEAISQGARRGGARV